MDPIRQAAPCVRKAASAAVISPSSALTDERCMVQLPNKDQPLVSAQGSTSELSFNIRSSSARNSSSTTHPQCMCSVHCSPQHCCRWHLQTAPGAAALTARLLASASAHESSSAHKCIVPVSPSFWPPLKPPQLHTMQSTARLLSPPQKKLPRPA